MHFEENKDIAQNAEIYAFSTVEFVKENYDIILDFSDSSIKIVEEILDGFHQSALKQNPTSDQKWEMAKIFGSYIGEVLRLNHDAKWGLIQANTEEIVGMKICSSLLWPWVRCYNRIEVGSEENVWIYFNSMIQKD